MRYRNSRNKNMQRIALTLFFFFKVIGLLSLDASIFFLSDLNIDLCRCLHFAQHPKFFFWEVFCRTIQREFVDSQPALHYQPLSHPAHNNRYINPKHTWNLHPLFIICLHTTCFLHLRASVCPKTLHPCLFHT